MIRFLVCLLTMSLAVNCANQTGAQTAMAVAEPLKAPIAALAGKVGVNESYVTMALSTAQSLMGQGKDQATAAKAGVDQAASKATADGKAMSSDQQASLLSGLTGLLGGK
jgi:hypothetical protein